MNDEKQSLVIQKKLRQELLAQYRMERAATRSSQLHVATAPVSGIAGLISEASRILRDRLTSLP